MTFLSSEDRHTIFADVRNPGTAKKVIRGAVGDSHLAVTLTDTTDLTKVTHFSHRILMLDPGGAARQVNLPTEAEMDGYMGVIVNSADAAEAITVKEDAGSTTIATIDQNEACLLFCDGTSWMGIILTKTGIT